MKMHENDDTIKFSINDQTIILDISPETPQFWPKTILKRGMPNNIITIDSANEIASTIQSVLFSSEMKLFLELKLSATC